MSFIEILQEFPDPDKAADEEGYLLEEWDAEYRTALTHLMDMITPSTVLNIPDIKAAYMDIFNGSPPLHKEIKIIEDYCNENGGITVNEFLTSSIMNLKDEGHLPAIEKSIQDVCERCREFESCKEDCQEMKEIKKRLGVE